MLPDVPATQPGTKLTAGDQGDIYYIGAFDLSLHSSETAHYRDNLASGRPALWVVLHPGSSDEFTVGVVTADPYEGEALSQGNGEVVEAVPMPPEIRDKIASFVDRFHVERPFIKRQRDRADPEALARGALGPNRRNKLG